jgi:hypothetical protein
MNIDLVSTLDFSDTDGLLHFLNDHRFVHDQESTYLTAQFGGQFPTFGLFSSIAEDNWIQLMRTRQGPVPRALQDWLQIHASIHNQTYQAIAGEGTVAPDLSVVDFSKPDQFYDWMYVHQQMHDYEQQFLGFS